MRGVSLRASIRSLIALVALRVGTLVGDGPRRGRGPDLTRMPAVDVKAARGISVRSSTNWCGGTLSARSIARCRRAARRPAPRRDVPTPQDLPRRR